ncbi:hypothetical protein ATANTOWER_013714 [Ataeniobius toweri]|uniref:Uncharacterized protein n=1 Tax=Ataeniobius toweri TaxID=208326 RepID=A0ABU7BGJ1_9TELE|nr:hypothetical protein [Ataeniobius toweri]
MSPGVWTLQSHKHLQLDLQQAQNKQKLFLTRAWSRPIRVLSHLSFGHHKKSVEKKQIQHLTFYIHENSSQGGNAPKSPKPPDITLRTERKPTFTMMTATSQAMTGTQNVHQLLFQTRRNLLISRMKLFSYPGAVQSSPDAASQSLGKKKKPVHLIH